MMRVTDVAAAAALAKQHGLLCIVDNTFLTPYLQRPLSLGADIVVHSGSKYLGGHNDTLAGFLVTANAQLAERLRFIHKTTGACLAPFDSWLLIRGIKTLAVRMERQQESAKKIARWLGGRAKIKAVHYPGLGAMLSFEVDSGDTAIQILERVALIQFAESLGGVESLITYPMLQTHADMPQEKREAGGINERLLRLSVGLECVDDLIADLANALGEQKLEF
jgi:cystathionine beta-lyase/cystathionine gamma-synthase